MQLGDLVRQVNSDTMRYKGTLQKNSFNGTILRATTVIF